MLIVVTCCGSGMRISELGQKSKHNCAKVRNLFVGKGLSFKGYIFKNVMFNDLYWYEIYEQFFSRKHIIRHYIIYYIIILLQFTL